MSTFFEFFAGGGMARAGLGNRWHCRFANDFDFKKSVTYRENWGHDALLTGDIRALTVSQLPGHTDLAWASFPCQDLSLAGGGAGLRGDRSGTFWPFWHLMKDLIAEGRGPRIIALENVLGTLTSHGGNDFRAICAAFTQANYRFGALVMDAAAFVPHSRPRLFIVGVHPDMEIPDELVDLGPFGEWHAKTLVRAHGSLQDVDQRHWVWWKIPPALRRVTSFSDIIEDDPSDVEWHTAAETQKLLNMMSPVNLAKVHAMRDLRRRMVGTIYKRTRLDESGVKVQRAEVRFDDLAGCLRTPAGGSSRQLILVVEKKSIRSRLISGRETARLMGLPDTYRLPSNYNETYHLTGDGVVVPVVRHLAQSLFEPLLEAQEDRSNRSRAA